MQLLPLFLDKLSVLKACYLLFILLCITLVSFVVFVSILNHRYPDDHHQGNCHDGLAVRDGYALNRLHERDDEEVDVCHLLELTHQVQRDKCKHIVFARSHHV